MKSVWERSQAGGKHRRCFSPDSGWVKTDSWRWGSAKQDAGCRMLPGAVLVGGGQESKVQGRQRHGGFWFPGPETASYKEIPSSRKSFMEQKLKRDEPFHP